MMKSSITELQGMMGGELAQSMQQLRQSAAAGEGQMRATLDLAKEMGSGIARQQEARKLRGKALFELDRMDESKQAYEAALAAGKDEPPRSLAEAHLGLAIVGTRTKDWQLARRNFEALVAVNDRDATSHLNVARACLELKDLDCAVSHAEIAGRLRGDEEPVLYTLGTVYLAAGKVKEAELTFRHICEVVPGASSCPYGLALVAAKGGDKPTAIAKLREAIEKKIPEPDKIAIEPGFAGLKDDPEFQALVAKASQK
jgi:tetratricopeptide (TPR) repeat protein